ncbi:LIC_13387 family protein [Pseudoalteromonas maricaloris]
MYTFSTEKFNPYDISAAEAMKRTSPQLTKETTIWRAWIGFNASHSLGLCCWQLFIFLWQSIILKLSKTLFGFHCYP